MSDPKPQEAGASRILAEMERIKRETPSVTNIVEAFEGLLLERERIKGEIETPEPESALTTDPARLSKGIPAVGRAGFAIPTSRLKDVYYRLAPAMIKGFPGVRPKLEVLGRAFNDGSLDLEAAIKHLLADRQNQVEKIARAARVKPDIFSFVLGQIVRPFVEKEAERIGPSLSDLHWDKGYCPVCGSWPSLSLLKGKEGRRWLKCSFCSHEWTHLRTACPFCENEDLETMEYSYAEKREGERVEVCHKCKRYVLSLDMRDRLDQTTTAATSIGLIHLDIIAQDKGFVPGAVTDWNVLDK
ncbi:MAG: formate dehydrogenase accessory protein FdhE [Deltaproteobacteria bacterium]|nr:formate dehydrogenase accessory protein FdhE [Deltaproteobacteria bacterium]